MPLYLWKRADGRSPYFYVRGTVTVWRDGRKCSESIKQESTGTADRAEAEAILTQVAARYQRGNIESEPTSRHDSTQHTTGTSEHFRWSDGFPYVNHQTHKHPAPVNKEK